MIIEKVTHYALHLDPGELAAVEAVLWDGRRVPDVVAPWDWASSTRLRLIVGEPLSRADADELCRQILGHLHRRYEGQPWPATLDSIAAKLQAALP